MTTSETAPPPTEEGPSPTEEGPPPTDDPRPDPTDEPSQGPTEDPRPGPTEEKWTDGGALRRRQRLGAYAIARDEEGRVLLVRAAPYLTVAGMWFLPGGGVEHGETPVEALRREVHEETGLEPEKETLLGVLSDTWPIPGGILLHTVRLLYQLEEWSGTLTHEASGSSDQAAWFTPQELASARLVRYAREALDRYGPVPGIGRPTDPGGKTTAHAR